MAGWQRIAVDLNGEAPGGPLDAFFMSRPRYTRQHRETCPRSFPDDLILRKVDYTAGIVSSVIRGKAFHGSDRHPRTFSNGIISFTISLSAATSSLYSNSDRSEVSRPTGSSRAFVSIPPEPRNLLFRITFPRHTDRESRRFNDG